MAPRGELDVGVVPSNLRQSVALWPRLEPLIRSPWHREELLDFLEHLFGPFVQLDGFGITGTPPFPLERRGKLVAQGWHRVRLPHSHTPQRASLRCCGWR